MGLLSGLESLGLGNLENREIFEKEKKEAPKRGEVKAKASVEVKEEDLIYEKYFSCPVCDEKISTKIMKSGRAKLIGTDFDLRPRYEGIEAAKYDVVLCPLCGYAALGRYFATILPAQRKLIRENISANVKVTYYGEDIYSFEEATERYKLALANTVVKKGKMSERAYVCLKSAWVLRGYQEELAEEDEEGNADKIASLKEQENEYLENAYQGFLEARQSENVPIAGMDATTIDFLLAQLAFYNKDYDNAMKLSASILSSPNAKPQVKDKIRDLKNEIAAAKKAGT